MRNVVQLDTKSANAIKEFLKVVETTPEALEDWKINYCDQVCALDHSSILSQSWWKLK
ncbi:hypothetical protein [Thermoactinomyces sp. DSM 45892]|uniref:hypothetical protein n=1 Tax=Thermoactinomyces sp. DSM 45892 TaxID=1882753 RepID=UPI00089B6049|nr:hypothetical protein [Thermoactinomyces sp. DSM 45892]SDY83356.1 hypothetical protein SAMN05444416_10924 [Thermoactinomyces sp. DSM 45892]